MRGPIPAVLLMPVLGLGACATPGTSPERFSQTQLNDIETREVEAGLDETFTAASHALFDAGYTIAMSDRQGGLLTGVRGVDRTWHRVLISKYIRDTAYAISIQIRAEAPRRCSVRVKLSVNGEPRVDKEAVDQLWVLMQRQVLMKEPPRIEGADPKAGSRRRGR